MHTFGARLASKLARNPGQASIARLAVILSRTDSVRHPKFITKTGLKLFLEVHCWLQSKRVMDGSERLKDDTPKI